MSNAAVMETKGEAQHVDAPIPEYDVEKSRLDGKNYKHGDDALKLIGDERIEISDADNRRLARKTDRYLLLLLSWVYILQIMDKSVFGNGAIFGMRKDLDLVGNQYSQAASIHPIAQLVWQPFSSYILVRFNMRYLLCVLVFGWGVAQCCIAATHNFGGLMAARFFLGLFEAGCLPAFSLLTAQWYRRSEQPLRVAVWYSSSGWATIIGALISYGLGHVRSPPAAIAGWRLIFLVTGLLTICTVPFVWWIIDGDVLSSRFLNEQDKRMVIERLRANQTGTGSHEFKWAHVKELFIDPKIYLFLMLTIVCNIGAGVSQYIGPSLINNFGFNTYVSTLLTIPFGVLQVIFIYAGCYAGQVSRFKSIIIGTFTLGTIAGCIMLYTSATGVHFHQNVSLGGYYMLAWNWGCMPLIIAWVVANTGGQTKKSLAMAVFQVGGGVGNIIGPLIFPETDAPHYVPGIRTSLGLFCAMAACAGIQAGILYYLNKRNERRRVAVGKPAKIKDTSMARRYEMYGGEDVAHLGQNALLDLSDLRNDEFTYVY